MRIRCELIYFNERTPELRSASREKALMEIGVSCSEVSRFSAVTTIPRGADTTPIELAAVTPLVD